MESLDHTSANLSYRSRWNNSLYLDCLDWYNGLFFNPAIRIRCMKTYYEAEAVKVYSRYLPSPKEIGLLVRLWNGVAMSCDDALLCNELARKRYPEGVNVGLEC